MNFVNLHAQQKSQVVFRNPINLDAENGTSSLSASTSARPVKRRRVAGLNTRFDHMIEKVNVTHSYANSASSPATSRRRMRSAGTSSVSSYDVPKTPVDPYSALHQGRFGKEFYVLKTIKLLDSALTRTEPCQGSDEYAELAAAPAKKPRVPLPDWLANTFSTLESEHPLRSLLSPSKLRHAEQPNPSHEEQVFAFSPFDEQVHGAPETQHTDDYPNIQGADLPDISEVLTLRDLGPQSPGEIRTKRDFLPFSTPGCFAPKPNSLESLPDNAIFPTPRPERQWSPRAQQDTSSCVTLAPLPASPTDGMKRPRFTRESMTFAPDALAPSECQVDHALVNVFSQDYQKHEENIGIYATPGPTFTCSRPVYFDSPTEDPSFSDPLEPEAYELDLNAIDFRWRPFLRSNAQTNQHPYCPSRLQSFGSATSKETGDQTGWKTHIAAGHTDFDASSVQGLRCPLPEDKEEVYIEFSPNAAQQARSATSMGAFKETVGSSSPSPPVGEGKEVEIPSSPGFGIFISPLPNQLGSTGMAGGVQPRAGDDEDTTINNELPLVKAAPRRNWNDSSLRNAALNANEADTNIPASNTSEGQIESASSRASATSSESFFFRALDDSIEDSKA
ncbi:hypothetical protein PAXRUDRAFT_24789 [Paxillus rubicundulus Ve08.2h10]|uniref:Unplaced genomic scaffold scaffold_130, whole genome shotgun sequence n=1 Tax=Paxillus rubicundulus Ve08.2h10 TaxID=930991 RepID=A0A0D0E6I6_9AGAM|nr:hypothetical protein PAXRUDRAFT_24789 [Paxillus rubicundulus Ve08.2h10]